MVANTIVSSSWHDYASICEPHGMAHVNPALSLIVMARHTLRAWPAGTCQRSFDGPLGQCGSVAWGGAGRVPQRNTRHVVLVTIPKVAMAWACRSMK